MSDSKEADLRSLVRLLDDDHPTVRRAVQSRLASFGVGLRSALREAVPELSGAELELALELGGDERRHHLLLGWAEWMSQPSGPEKLEAGHCLVAQYLDPEMATTVDIPETLSELAMDHELEYGEPDFRSLAEFLFADGRFRGARERYYHPHSSNLAAVLQTGEGNPISLACIYILTGRRLGLDVGGCNYPVHFLARARCAEDGELYLIDCFNEGHIIHSRDLIEHHPLSPEAVTGVVTAPAAAELIISRVLRNLENAFRREGQRREEEFMRQLWRKLAVAEPGDDL
jgi:regulator of sirC expression with transglutaminase-like and TPR domain